MCAGSAPMQRRNLIRSLLAVPATLLAQQKPNLAIAGSNPPAATYVVSDPNTFPALPMPAKGLVVWNGLVLTPVIDYTVLNGQTVKLTRPISQGDRITIFDLS